MRKSSAMLAAAMLSVTTMLPTRSIKIPRRIDIEIINPFKRYGVSTGKRRRSRAEVRGW